MYRELQYAYIVTDDKNPTNHPIYAVEKDLVSRILNWAHWSVDKHTTHKIDHTIYSVIEEWNNAKMVCSYEFFSLIKE